MLKTGRPRHEQISEILRDRIESGTYGPDDQLPSESQLGQQFEVSRITVRRALHTLESERLIYKRQGLGSFVRSRTMQQGLVHLTDFVEDMSRAGLTASSRVVHEGAEEAAGVISEMLEVDPGSEVYRVDRVRLGDDQAVAFDRTWLPPVYGNLIRQHPLGEETIYHVLEHEYGIPVAGGRYRIEAVNARADVAEHLGVPWGRALLLIERVSWTLERRPVYFQRRFYRSDRVAYELELARDMELAPGSGRSRGMPLREFEPVFRKREEPHGP
jgi:GntR family transcriptional regulator